MFRYILSAWGNLDFIPEFSRSPHLQRFSFSKVSLLSTPPRQFISYHFHNWYNTKHINVRTIILDRFMAARVYYLDLHYPLILIAWRGAHTMYWQNENLLGCQQLLDETWNGPYLLTRSYQYSQEVTHLASSQKAIRKRPFNCKRISWRTAFIHQVLIHYINVHRQSGWRKKKKWQEDCLLHHADVNTYRRFAT